MSGILFSMADVLPLPPIPRVGDLFLDARGDGRTMRVSLHPDRGVVVVSLWAGVNCRASFRLPIGDAERLAGLLAPPPSAESTGPAPSETGPAPSETGPAPSETGPAPSETGPAPRVGPEALPEAS
jgi:hypothetical protein